ncbi:5-formyltetrahydrofolate cyclo-ligase [Psychromicrobium sp. YIM B11713]|uniref:5-formyltetrahydrofolate cyclo-ligase n=1 Tax=Psychromicrobium sp. YIM B11713 TaxID=3145233 RepID=UPI00374EF1C7
MAKEKTSQRRLLRAARSSSAAISSQVSAEGLRTTGLELFNSLELPGARQAIAGYLPLGDEPDVIPLLTALELSSRTIYLPVCEPDFQLSWVSWQPGVPLRRSSFAPVWEPVGEPRGIEVMNSVGLILLPALAVDSGGTRMGQGGGYYDRFLGSLQNLDSSTERRTPGLDRPVTAAVVYPQEFISEASLPKEEHDQAVDYVLTPEFFSRLEC